MAGPAASVVEVSETKKTKEQERDRAARIIEHARKGHTMMEIVDLEGLDPGNVKRWHKLVRDAGVTIEMGRASRPPSGIRPSNDAWRYRIGRVLNDLRDAHPQIEVSRMVGMTNVQIKNATAGPRDCTHDWTVSQLQRLADVSGIPFESLIVQALTTKPVKENP